MQVDMKLSFELDDEDEKEKFEKITDLLLDKEEEECCEDESEEDSEPDYKSALESIKEKVQELYDEAKSGSPSEKAYGKVSDAFDEILSEYEIELD